jgi:hypothetical protein
MTGILSLIAGVVAPAITLLLIVRDPTPAAVDYTPPYPPPVIEAPRAAPVPPPPKPKRYIYGPVVYVVPMRVTACSPHDPKDKAYYAKNGYEGDAYGIAAYKPHYPVGTQMRIPGYMRSRWEEVDSSGGSVIRRSVRKGKEHIDVKYRTLHSVVQWGSQDLNVEVILPAGATEAQRQRIANIAIDSYPSWVKEITE